MRDDCVYRFYDPKSVYLCWLLRLLFKSKTNLDDNILKQEHYYVYQPRRIDARACDGVAAQICGIDQYSRDVTLRHGSISIARDNCGRRALTSLRSCARRPVSVCK